MSIYARVRDLAPGEQITKPGIYRIPIKRYHDDPNLFPGHSLLEHDLPADEFALCNFENWNTNEGKPSTHKVIQEVKDDDGQLSIGRDGQPEMETLTLKGWRDNNGNIFKNYLEYKKVWKSFAEWSELTIVQEKDVVLFKAMAARLAKEPMIQDGILEGLVEHTICWQDPITGIWIKVRPDVIPGALMLGDYKTAASAHPKDICKSISEYGYDQQLAICMEGIARVLGRVIDSAFFVVQEKKEPYMVTIAPVRDDTLWWGARQNRKALDDIKRCLDAGDWPGYGGGAPVTVGHSPWKMKQLMDHQEAFEDDPLMRLPDVENLEQLKGAV